MAAAPVPAIVSRLIPRLGSTYDGEVVATARAIGRTLASHGLDWHDFANAVDHGLDQPRSSNHSWHHADDDPAAPLWGELNFDGRVAWLNALDSYGLSYWEFNFVESIARQQFNRLRTGVCPEIHNNREFKTIECSIMDVADDVAYSTYDLEDTFKAIFLDPLKILGSSTATKKSVANKVSTILKCQFDEDDVDRIFLKLFSGLGDEVILPRSELSAAILLAHASNVASASRQLTSNGYLRTQFTADLVSEFMSGVELQFDERHPVLSSVSLKDTVARKVETIKHYTYETTIMASRLRVPEQRGFDIISILFEKLDSPK